MEAIDMMYNTPDDSFAPSNAVRWVVERYKLTSDIQEKIYAEVNRMI